MPRKTTFLFVCFILAICAAGSGRPSVDRFTLGPIGDDDYQWAHHSNKLAMLIGGDIYILDAEKKKTYRAISLSPNKFEIETFAWLKDDSGFLFGRRYFRLSDEEEREEEYFSGDKFYVCDLRTKKIDEAYANMERVFCEIREIYLDSESEYWAVGYSCEGCSGVGIYKGEKLLFEETPDFRGGIGVLGWRNGKQYCQTDAPIDVFKGIAKGQTWEQYQETRSKHLIEKTWKQYENNALHERYSPFRVFCVDPKTGKAARVSIPAKDIRNTSYDGKYYVVIKTNDNGSTIELY
jgi:hypothetical protein